MARYSRARFDQIEFTKNKFYQIPEHIAWNDLIDRTQLYQYDESIYDLDYLMTIVDMDSLFEIPYATATIDGKYQGRPDLYAFDVYGDADFYWVICLTNGIDDFSDFKEGYQYKIPDRNFLLNWLTNARFKAKQMENQT